MEGDLCNGASLSHSGFELGVSLVGDDAYEGGNLLSFISVGNEHSEHDSFAIVVVMPVITWSFSDLWCFW